MRRKSYSANFKARVAVEAIRGVQTIHQIASHFEVHPTQASLWKKQALESLKEGFSVRRGRARKQEEALKDELYGPIGRLPEGGVGRVKKSSALSRDEKRCMVEPGPLSKQRPCELPGLARSSLYYEPAKETACNLALMRSIDQTYTVHPFLGVRRMTQVLRGQGYRVHHKRVYRLMRPMGLQAIYPKRRQRTRVSNAAWYPNLWNTKKPDAPNQAWCSDLTYTRMQQGFAYLVAVMDCYSRYVLSWAPSSTQEANICAHLYREALSISQPEIFHSDQGSQYKSEVMTRLSNSAGIRISMCGRGRRYDTSLMERLWRSVTYEEVYLHEYVTLPEARKRLDAYVAFYNHHRLHQSLPYRSPAAVYYELDGNASTQSARNTTLHGPLGTTRPRHNP